MITLMQGVATIVVLFFTAQVGNCFDSRKATVIFRSPRSGKEFLGALLVKEDIIIVGGRDFFSRLRFPNSSIFSEETGNYDTVDVHADKTLQDQCRQYVSGASTTCSNNIHVLEFVSSEKLLVCGTNAQEAKCFYYDMETAESEAVDLDASQWLSVTRRTKTLLCGTNSTDRSFYATSKSRVGSFRRLLPGKTLKTPDTYFTDAEFVSIHEFTKKDYVYIMFTEKSTYFSGEKFTTGQSEQRYSMIGRACKTEIGGTWRTTWVTLNKLRLLCPWPGTLSQDAAKFYYDELIATFQMDSTIYGLFRPNRDWKLSTYAVAKYDIGKIDEYFDGVAFNDKSAHYFDEDDPDREAKFSSTSSPFLPGQCPLSVPYTLDNAFESFVQKHFLVKAIVKPIDNAPFYVGDEDVNYEFIFVREFSSSTTVFLLSRNGFMKKLLISNDKTVTEIFQKRVTNNEDPIRNAKIAKEQDAIVAVTQNVILALPLSYCEEHLDCQSCVKDPHCFWKADLGNAEFLCRRRTSFNSLVDSRCFAAPNPPKHLQAKFVEDDVQLSWETDSITSQNISNVITIVLKKKNEVITRHKTASLQYSVNKSELLGGCTYEVKVATMGVNAISEETRATFNTDLAKPKVDFRYIGSIIAVNWSPVAGASTYKVRSYDSDRTLLQEVSFHAVTPKQTFFQPYTGSVEYTVNVTAESDDLISSTAALDISPQPTTAGTTTPTTIPLPIEIQQQTNSTVTTRSSPSPTTVAAKPSTTPESPGLIERFTTTLPDEAPFNKKSIIKNPSPNYASAGDNKSALERHGGCFEEIGGLLAFLILFIVAVGIHVCNYIAIKPSSLKDNNNCEYYRRYFIIWTRKEGKPADVYLKCDDVVMTSSNA